MSDNPNRVISYRWCGPKWAMNLSELMLACLIPMFILLDVTIIDRYRPIIGVPIFMVVLGVWIGIPIWMWEHYHLYRPVPVYESDLAAFKGPRRWRLFRARFCWRDDPERDRPPVATNASAT